MRRTTSLFIFLLFSLFSQAVLKEKNLEQTLKVLQSELQTYYNDLTATRKRLNKQRHQLRLTLNNYTEEANQISLMVYSQQQDYIFDITYACRQATDLYERFHSKQIPFDTLQAELSIEVQRYHGLRNVLSEIEADTLETVMLQSRAECLRLSDIISNELERQQTELASFQQQYDRVNSQLEELRAYADNRYRDIQANVFLHAGHGYLTQWRNFYSNLLNSNGSLLDKLSTRKDVDSQWHGTVVYMVFAIILLYGLLAAFLGYLIWRFVLPRFPRIYNEFETPHNGIMCFALSTFAVIVGVLNLVVEHNFIRMATGLLMQFAILATAIQLSIIVRMSGKQERAGLNIYAPLLTMGFIVIVTRIVFAPGMLISLYLPPLLLMIAVWQWRLIKRNSSVLPKSDISYAWITFALMVISFVLSLVGRTLMGVEVFIWWMMQITCVQAIACLYDLLERYEKHVINQGATIQQTWLIELTNRFLLPVMAIASFLFSIYWSADVFDMSSWVWQLFLTSFINIEGVIHLSLWRLCTIAVLFFMARYIMHIVRQLLELHYSGSHYPNARGAIVIGRNVASIIIWGGWLIITMLLLGIDNSWILVITGGLSTGIGFALKDTLENFFYGLSLMLGRVHIGDVIECDGVRGVISNISYQSTTVQSIDGAEMAFLNSQLFSKNFKNMTRNHNLELVVIPVGVAYGTDVEFVRQSLIADLEQLDCYDRQRGISVAFMDFGASSVDLKVVLWVDVMSKGVSVARIKECIYNCLNRKQIEIPFPQLDVHQR